MNASGSWWQYAAVAVAVLASLAQVLRKTAPRMTGRFQAALAASLDRPGRSSAMRRVGRRLWPQAVQGCGDGCSTCGACATGGQPAADAKRDGAQPIRFFDRPTGR